MFSMRNDYDRGVNTFSPEGRLFQVEYAIEAIKFGSTSVGIQTAEGVVLACEKKLKDKLLEPNSVEKIMEVDSHVGVAMSGLVGDARIMVKKARVESQNYRFSYNEPMSVLSVTQAVCDLALKFGEGGDKERGMSRPFGCALLVAGIDEKGPRLFHTDPSGTYTRYFAKAIGAGSQAQNVLKDEYNKSMGHDEATVLAIKVLKQVMEEKISSKNVEVGVITTKDPQFKLKTPKEIKEILEKLDD